MFFLPSVKTSCRSAERCNETPFSVEPCRGFFCNVFMSCCDKSSSGPAGIIELIVLIHDHNVAQLHSNL